MAASNTILGPGPLADKTGAVAARLLTKYAVPERLLEKPASDLFNAPPISSAFADRSREYPTNSAVATWTSAAAYHDTRSTDPEAGRRIKEACDWYGLSSEWDRLEANRPPEPAPPAVEKWALPGKKMYPLDTEDEVKQAISYFNDHADWFDFEDRRVFAGELAKMAESFPNLFPSEGLWRLEAEAGLGLPADDCLVEFTARAKKARSIGLSDVAELIEKAAMAVDYGGGGFSSTGAVNQVGSFRNAGEMAAMLRALDTKLGWDSDDVLKGMVGETPSTAKAKIAALTRSGTGHWYRNEDLDRVPEWACAELCNLGPVVSRSAKMAALADPKSPFEKLARSQGVEPVQAPRRPRIDWSAQVPETAGV